MNCWWFLLCRSSKTLSSSFKFIFCIKMIIFNNRYWILWNKEEIRGYAWFLEFFFLFCFLFLVLFCFFWLFMSIYYSQHWAHYISLMKTFGEFFIYKRMKEREDKTDLSFLFFQWRTVQWYWRSLSIKHCQRSSHHLNSLYFLQC